LLALFSFFFLLSWLFFFILITFNKIYTYVFQMLFLFNFLVIFSAILSLYLLCYLILFNLFHLLHKEFAFDFDLSVPALFLQIISISFNIILLFSIINFLRQTQPLIFFVTICLFLSHLTYYSFLSNLNSVYLYLKSWESFTCKSFYCFFSSLLSMFQFCHVE